MMYVLFAPSTRHSTPLMLHSTDSYSSMFKQPLCLGPFTFPKISSCESQTGSYSPSPPLHSMEVVGRNYCLFKYKLKCWPLRSMGLQQLLVDHRGNRVLLFQRAPPLLAESSKGSQTEHAEAKASFPSSWFPHLLQVEYERQTSCSIIYLVADI